MNKKSLSFFTKAPAIEKTLFEYLCLIQCVLLLCLIIQDILMIGYSWILLADLVVSGIGLLFFYLSRFKNIFDPLRIPLIIFLMIAIVLFWSTLGGYTGLLSVIALGIGLVIIIIAPVKYRLLYSVVIPIELVVLTLLQSTGIIEVGQYPPEVVPANYLLFSLSTLTLVYLLKVEFNKSRLKTEQQNLRLNSLNNALQDIVSEKERNIQNLKTTQSKLAQSEKLATLGRLTTGLIDELKSPASVLEKSVNTIQSDLNEIKSHLTEKQLDTLRVQLDRTRKEVSGIGLESEQLVTLTNNLQLVTTDIQENPLERIDLVVLIKGVCDNTQDSFPLIDIAIRSSGSVFVSANPNEIRQVIANILKNATEATKTLKSPKIDITVTKIGGSATVIFRDNGKEINQEDIPNIFQPVPSKTNKRVGGLGLFSSDCIIKNFGGSLTYETNANSACFEIKLPLVTP